MYFTRSITKTWLYSSSRQKYQAKKERKHARAQTFVVLVKLHENIIDLCKTFVTKTAIKETGNDKQT